MKKIFGILAAIVLVACIVGLYQERTAAAQGSPDPNMILIDHSRMLLIKLTELQVKRTAGKCVTTGDSEDDVTISSGQKVNYRSKMKNLADEIKTDMTTLKANLNAE